MGIFELDKIKENEMKEKAIREFKRRLWLVLKSKLNERNKITAINAWASALFRYGTGILQWKKSELKNAGKKINKNNDNVWGIKLEEWCGEIVHKEERGRQRSDECGKLR